MGPGRWRWPIHPVVIPRRAPAGVVSNWGSAGVRVPGGAAPRVVVYLIGRSMVVWLLPSGELFILQRKPANCRERLGLQNPQLGLQTHDGDCIVDGNDCKEETHSTQDARHDVELLVHRQVTRACAADEGGQQDIFEHDSLLVTRKSSSRRGERLSAIT